MNEKPASLSPEQVRRNLVVIYYGLLFGLFVFAGLHLFADAVPLVAVPIIYGANGFALLQVMRGLDQEMPESPAIKTALENKAVHLLLWPFAYPHLLRKLAEETKR